MTSLQILELSLGALVIFACIAGVVRLGWIAAGDSLENRRLRDGALLWLATHGEMSEAALAVALAPDQPWRLEGALEDLAEAGQAWCRKTPGGPVWALTAAGEQT